ncbi:MAG: Spo0E family sporulation regulatory protein-aspartic acid phosphatase [Clostridia bacterium]
MLVEEINILKVKLEDQIKKNEPYNMIYKTSVLIDKLLVEYYKKYGSNGKF